MLLQNQQTQDENLKTQTPAGPQESISLPAELQLDKSRELKDGKSFRPHGDSAGKSSGLLSDQQQASYALHSAETKNRSASLFGGKPD